MPAAPIDLESSFEGLRRGLDRQAGVPLYRQIVERLTQWIEHGDWASGQPLPTIKQLTAALGVSEMTVRRALADLAEAGLVESRRGRGTVVAGGAGRLGPAAEAARRLRIGVVFASLRDGYPFVEPMLGPLETGADDPARSVRLQVLHLDPGESDPNVIRHQLPLDELDGLMLMSPVNAALLWLCQRRVMPYVLLFNDVADGRSTRVVCDYHPGMHDAMARLVAVGRRRPALVTAGDERFSTGQISDAFHLACRLHGLAVAPGRVVAADYTQQHGYDAAMRLLTGADRPDVIFFSSDHQACGGWLAARKLAVRVPDDLAIIGTGNVVGPMQWPQRLSTIDLSLAEMSRAAVAALRAQIAAAQPICRRIVTRSRFLPGQTTPA